MVYKCLDNKSTLLADKSNSGSGVKTEIMSNQKVAEELLKPMRRNCLEVLRKNIAKKKKQIKKSLELSREMAINSMSNVKTMIILLIIGSIEKILIYNMSNIPEPYTHSKDKTKVELDLSNNASKSDIQMQQVLIHQNLLKRLI